MLQGPKLAVVQSLETTRFLNLRVSSDGGCPADDLFFLSGVCLQCLDDLFFFFLWMPKS